MKKKNPKSLVLFGNGINCEYETAHANRIVGFDVDMIHINRLAANPEKIHQYSFINFPGGFLDGDDLGAAKAQAAKWRHQGLGGSQTKFLDELIRFVQEGKIMLGICNGFQLLVKTGLLPGIRGEYDRQTVTLTFNDSGKFEARWVYLHTNKNSHCIFTKNMDIIYLPVRHGEGKCLVDNGGALAALGDGNHIVFQYALSNGTVTEKYPENPNGSVLAIAGLTDATGRVLGLMPHPEAYVHYTQHPRWTREKTPQAGDGLRIFENAYQYAKEL